MRTKAGTYAVLLILALLILYPIWIYGKERLEVIIFLSIVAPLYFVTWKLWAEKKVVE